MNRPPQFASLTDAEWKQVEEYVQRFQEACATAGSSSASMDLKPFLPPPGHKLRTAALHGLIRTDLELRWQRGQPVSLEQYLRDFPELGSVPDLPVDLVYEEYRVSQRYGFQPKLTVFQQRFPSQFAALEKMIAERSAPEPATLMHPTPPVTPPSPSPPPASIPSSDMEAGILAGTGYRLIKRLGRGTFGEVWQAEAPGGLDVAMKIVFRSLTEKEAQTERNALELTRRLRNPFLLQTHAFWSLQDRLVIAMELAEGSLRDRLKECQAEGKPGIPVEELLPYLKQAAEALDYLHENRLLHRDIKPENILRVDQFAKVADFGLATVLPDTVRSMTMTSAGTIPYMGPEVWRGRGCDASDQWSLAITYAELRLGRLPFTGHNQAEIMFAILGTQPDLVGLYPEEQQVLLRALAKEHGARYPSCTEFTEALELAVMPHLQASPGIRRSGVSRRPSGLVRRPPQLVPGAIPPQPSGTGSGRPEPPPAPPQPAEDAFGTIRGESPTRPKPPEGITQTPRGFDTTPSVPTPAPSKEKETRREEAPPPIRPLPGVTKKKQGGVVVLVAAMGVLLIGGIIGAIVYLPKDGNSGTPTTGPELVQPTAPKITTEAPRDVAKQLIEQGHQALDNNQPRTAADLFRQADASLKEKPDEALRRDVQVGQARVAAREKNWAGIEPLLKELQWPDPKAEMALCAQALQVLAAYHSGRVLETSERLSLLEKLILLKEFASQEQEKKFNEERRQVKDAADQLQRDLARQLGDLPETEARRAVEVMVRYDPGQREAKACQAAFQALDELKTDDAEAKKKAVVRIKTLLTTSPCPRAIDLCEALVTLAEAPAWLPEVAAAFQTDGMLPEARDYVAYVNVLDMARENKKNAARALVPLSLETKSRLFKVNSRRERAAQVFLDAAQEFRTGGSWSQPYGDTKNAGTAYEWLRHGYDLLKDAELLVSPPYKSQLVLAAWYRSAEATPADMDLVRPWASELLAKPRAADLPPDDLGPLLLAHAGSLKSRSEAADRVAALSSYEEAYDLISKMPGPKSEAATVELSQGVLGPAIALGKQIVSSGMDDALKGRVATLCAARAEGLLAFPAAKWSGIPDPIQEAVALFDQAAKYDPTKPDYIVQRGLAQLSLKTVDPKVVRSDAEALKKLGLDQPAADYFEGVASYLEALGQKGNGGRKAALEAAVGHLKKARESTQNLDSPWRPRLLVDLSDAARELALQSGDLPVRESNLELARQAAEQASEIKTRPEAWRAWMALGRAQVAIAWLLDRPAEYEKGVGSLSQAIQARPEDTALLIDRGRAYILWVRLGRGGAALLVKARNDLEQAVAKQLPPSQEAVALDWLGLLAMAASNYEEAQKKFTEAIKLISLGSVEGDLHIRAWLRAFKEQAIWDAIINPRLPPASWSLLSQVLGDRARQLKALAQDGPAALDLTLAQALIRLKASTKPDFQALIKDVDNALKLAEGPQIRTAARAETFALAGFLWKKYAEQNFMQTKEFHTGLDNWGMHYERALSEAPEYPDSFWWRMELAKAYEIDLKYRTTDKESDKWKDLYSRAEKQLKEALKTAPADPWHDAIKNQLKGLEKLKEQG